MNEITSCYLYLNNQHTYLPLIYKVDNKYNQNQLNITYVHVM